MSLEIDYSINPWLENIQIKDNKDYLNHLLNMGKQMANMSQISFNPETNFLQPINEKISLIDSNCNQTYNKMLSSLDNCKHNISSLNETMDKNYVDTRQQYQQLSQSIHKLTGDISTSSIKGKIGEHLLENMLKSAFPDDIVDVTALTGHEADIHLISEKYPKILIESKLYKNPVSTKEVDKFYNDLENTGVDYGLFVSISSSIMCHRRLEYKYKKGKHIVFIPNSGFESLNIIYGVLFLREMFSKNINYEKLSRHLVDEKCELIYNSLAFLDKIYENVSRIKNETLRSKSIIDTQIQSLITNVIESEVITKDLINKMKKNITESLSELDSNREIFQLCAFDKIIRELVDSGDKLNILVGNSLLLFQKHKVDIQLNTEKRTYIILLCGSKIAELKLAKTKATYDFSQKGIKYDIRSSTNLLEFSNLIDFVLSVR